MNQSDINQLKKIRSEIDTIIRNNERPSYDPYQGRTLIDDEWPDTRKQKIRDHIQNIVDRDETLETIEMSINTERMIYGTEFVMITSEPKYNHHTDGTISLAEKRRLFEIKWNHTLPFGEYLLIGPKQDGENWKKYYKEKFEKSIRGY